LYLGTHLTISKKSREIKDQCIRFLDYLLCNNKQILNYVWSSNTWTLEIFKLESLVRTRTCRW
jgi:hypothetical protein